MKAIILSAGQGRRLMPFTQDLPKCLLPVDEDRPVLEVQLQALRDAGIKQASIMVGFQAEKVESFLASDPVPGIRVETLFNPFFDSTENLVTAWLARSEMEREFLLLNGDTLFEPDVLGRLLDAPAAPITLVVNEKVRYDADDMKVAFDARGRIRAISKTLSDERVSGESIGLMRFSGDGVVAFQSGLDRAVRTQRGVHAYYLSVISELSLEISVESSLMTGLWWGELDSPEDLLKIRTELVEIRPRMIGGMLGRTEGSMPESLSTRAAVSLRNRRTAEKSARASKRIPAAPARSPVP